MGSLAGVVDQFRSESVARGGSEHAVFLIDHYFEGRPRFAADLGAGAGDQILFVATDKEPTTLGVDAVTAQVRGALGDQPAVVVGVGGGVTMDTAKAVANLLGNGGKAADYQGWDLLKHPAVPKIGVPTISGTGAEATRTCVLTNAANGLKLGMNSDYTVFDYVILDPELPETVERNQYFHTGMDAYIHCMEALAGQYRNPVGDALSRETMALCRRVFGADDMMSIECRESLMVASYLGGASIAMSYVGLVHPLSAGLSVVLGIHHCLANCITMRAMQEFYPDGYQEFWSLVEKQGVDIPEGVARGLTDDQYDRLFEASIIHEKPLTNHLGPDFKSVLSRDRVKALFQSM